ncbi:MAG: 4-hydroxy-3-methylbut-2-enyl diphosphate reductase [Alphaproteobacteria bacterium]|nr:4-hydroxy-3-methylbut-2-enyl diphosphate reductase [Alphaproteobacteria bacterium]
MQMRVILAEPRGFCAGVERAIDIVEGALARFGCPVYVHHEIVHNKRVVEELRKKGAVFVEELDGVPDGAVTIFSAHGVAQVVSDVAEQRSLPVIDATCPLVAKVHQEAQRCARAGCQVILIGHRDHPEVEGTSGRVPGGVLLISTAEDVESLEVKDPDKLAYVTQTTLSVDDTSEVIAALKSRFPSITGPSLRDICYATQNRQIAVHKLAAEVDVILVVGAQNSSNSNRLREIGEKLDVPSYLIDDADAIELAWFESVKRIGISAGASAPEQLVEEVIQRLRGIGEVNVKALEGVVERVQFKLPPELLADT